MVDRRSVLRSIAIGTTGVAVTGTPVSADEDIHERRRELILEDRIEEARDLMEDHGLEFSSSTSYLDTESESEGVQPQDRWGSPDERSETRLNVNIAERENKYEVLIQWNLDRVRTWGDGTAPCGDAAAVYWADDWQLVGAGRDNFFTDDDRVSYDGVNGVNGIMAKVNSPTPGTWFGPKEYSSAYYTFVEKIGDDAEDRKIFAEYVHTWDSDPLGGCGGAEVSFSLGPGGISFTGKKDDWTMGADTEL